MTDLEKIDLCFANARRMTEMKLTDHEAQQVVGLLAGCEEMSEALDAVERMRKMG